MKTPYTIQVANFALHIIRCEGTQRPDGSWGETWGWGIMAKGDHGHVCLGWQGRADTEGAAVEAAFTRLIAELEAAAKVTLEVSVTLL